MKNDIVLLLSVRAFTESLVYKIILVPNKLLLLDIEPLPIIPFEVVHSVLVAMTGLIR